ncbi:hypothetical protein QJS10_CPA05g02074 [Acorus calamus]|uniref:Uncharacterized protein n=1 Tax=Acorus calamus TaxID=4465 RepID=A0AAV9EXS0_ACOCL|nr:hypothetical protein QJS10_CPA05g02074 [Acorus calamus]
MAMMEEEVEKEEEKTEKRGGGIESYEKFKNAVVGCKNSAECANELREVTIEGLKDRR